MDVTLTKSSLAVHGTVAEVTAWLRQQPRGPVPLRTWLAHWLAVTPAARTDESAPGPSERSRE